MSDLTHADCLSFQDPMDHSCSGDMVSYYSEAAGTLIIRCAIHQQDRDERLARANRAYPDTSMPPRWFDPANAGEHWDYDY